MTLDQLSAAATEAIKATGYKYFGDYELSKDQWEAVDALVEFARVVTHQLRTGQLVAVSDDAVERVARAMFIKELGEPDDWDKWQSLLQEYRNLAKAAIAAMKDAQPAIKSTKPPIL